VLSVVAGVVEYRRWLVLCVVSRLGWWLSVDKVEKGAHEVLGFTLSSLSHAPGRMRHRA
jgi:hypothetical protein